jgi:nucleoid-associated protein YgaU
MQHPFADPRAVLLAFGCALSAATVADAAPATRPTTAPVSITRTDTADLAATVPAPAEIESYLWHHVSGGGPGVALDPDAGAAFVTALRTPGTTEFWMKNGFPPGVTCALPVRPNEWITLCCRDGRRLEIGLAYDGRLIYPGGGSVFPEVAVGPAIPDALRNLQVQDARRITSATRPTRYVVGTLRDHGTLSGIARLFYGDAKRWKDIYAANREQLKNPDAIRDGMALTIP